MQCQSLSLCRVVLLRSVCLSVRLTVESRAVRWPTRSQNLSKITAKIDRKLIPGDASGHPKSTQNRSWDDTPWRARASRRRLGSVLGASRSVPGAPLDRPEGRQGRPGTPERAAGSVREHAEATKIDAKSHPGAKKSSFSRAARLRSIVGAMFRPCWLIFGFSAKSANP